MNQFFNNIHPRSTFVKSAYFILWLMALCLSSAAQSKYKYAREEPGKWNYTYLNEAKGGYRSDANYVLAPAELSAFKKNISNVVEVLHQNPVTLNPEGYEATVMAGIYANMFRYNYKPANLAGKIPQCEIVIRFCPLSMEIATGKIVKNCMEVQHCDVWLNSLERTESGSFIFEDIDKRNPHSDASKKMNEVFQAPELYQMLDNGVSLYANGLMVFSSTERPIWIPVTAGDYFDRLIKYWTLESEKEGNSMFLDMLLFEKKKFSEAELKMPAYNGENPASQITIVPNNRPYMRLNPNYFDKRLPRSAVQLITININPDALDKQFDPKYYMRAETYMDILRFYEYSKAIDIPKIKSLLAVK